MYKGLIAGAMAFGAVWAVDKMFANVGQDLARYDRLRAMSGEGPFLREQLQNVFGMLSNFGQTHQDESKSFVTSLGSDLMRYARMRGM